MEKAILPVSWDVAVSGSNDMKDKECVFCGKIFQWKSALSRHMRLHTSEKKFVCPYCPYRAHRKEHIDQHTHVHVGHNPHVCHICGYSTLYRANLENHIRNHLPNKDSVD